MAPKNMDTVGETFPICDQMIAGISLRRSSAGLYKIENTSTESVHTMKYNILEIYPFPEP